MAFDGRSVFNEGELGTQYLICRSAWIRASESTLRCMVKTSSHVLTTNKNRENHRVNLIGYVAVH